LKLITGFGAAITFGPVIVALHEPLLIITEYKPAVLVVNVALVAPVTGVPPRSHWKVMPVPVVTIIVTGPVHIVTEADDGVIVAAGNAALTVTVCVTNAEQPALFVTV
jgi:hypothetical protein